MDSLFHRRFTGSNLCPHQEQILQDLRNNKDLMLIKTDKNLGPAVIKRKTYCQHAFLDHLDNKSHYTFFGYDIKQANLAMSGVKDSVIKELKYCAKQEPSPISLPHIK